MGTALEHVLTSTYKVGMISYLKAHPEDIDEAIKLAISDRQPYAWRAAWLLWSCMEENDPRVQKYIKEIVNSVKEKKDGHQRELIKILLQMDLAKKYEGLLFNICLDVWEQINKNPSVRYTAMKFIIKMAKKHPDLAKEITFLTQDQFMETLSPGVKRSLDKMMK
jgi:hypothetical protein